MARNYDDLSSIRRYLLNQLTDEGQQEIEQRLFTDDELFDQLQAAEEELIDQYLSGELSKDEAEMFEKYFLVTAERQQKLRFAKAFRRYVATHTAEQPQKTSEKARPFWDWRKFVSVAPLRAAAFAALILIAAFGVWRIYFFQSDVDKGLLALNAAYRDQRPVEARLSSLLYAPYSTTRGPGTSNVNESELRRAELTLLDALDKNPTPAVRHALGKVYLAKKQFDDAIKEFDEALKGDPKNAQLYSDLGAAWLEKGKFDLEKAKANPKDPSGGKGLEELGRGLQDLNKAWELDSRVLEALFNRALCYEEMMLWQQAEDAWQNYLAHDATSPWAGEAKQRLDGLQHRKQKTSRKQATLVGDFLAAFRNRSDETAWNLVRENYNSSGNSIANELLNSCLSPTTKDHGEQLQALSYLGELERRRAGDSYYSDVARFYALQLSKQREALARAHQQMDEAYEHFTKSRSSEAINLYTSAKREFDRLGDFPESNFAEYRIAHSYVIQPNTEMSRDIFVRLSSICQGRQYRWLVGQSLLGLANISFNLSQYSQAIVYSTRGLQLFQDTGYIDGLLRILRQLADEHQALNKKTESLAFLRQALDITKDHFSEPMQEWGIYTTVAFNFDSLALFTAAAAYQVEALSLAVKMERPLITSRSYAYLGKTYGKLKNYEESIINLQQAYETGKGLSAEPDGVDMMANSSLQLGDVYRLIGNYSKALEFYDQCIHLYDRLGFQYYNYAAHRGKLLTYVNLEDALSTDSELRTILSSLERYRLNITEQSQRNSFFETQQSIYDAAINFSNTRKRDPQTAFEYSELSRARTLLDLLEQGSHLTRGTLNLDIKSVTQPKKLSDIQRNIPGDSQILEYSVLDKKLVIWLITSTSFSMEEIEIDASALGDQVRQFLTTLNAASTNSNENLAQQAKHLHNILVRPVESSLDKNRTLCIVPDKILHYLPFGALVSSSSSHYLIEDYRIELSPSATAFVYLSKLATGKVRAGEEKLLSVGNPSFDRSAFVALPDLPSAAREAEGILSYYKSPLLLTQGQAREGQVKAQIAKSDVVHLALHYMVDERSEMLSKLILAKEQPVKEGRSNEDGVLQAYEIYGRKLPQTRLVVLSACQTGIERLYDGEGAVGIARPFMVAGVPLVVASLWPVESESSAELMIDFHKHRRQDRVSSVEALRRAQLDLIRSTNLRYREPYYWASFVAIGGYATF